MNSHGLMSAQTISFHWILFIILISTPIATNGVCLHNDNTYYNQSVWQPDPCTVCTCHDPVTLCEDIVCQDPQCNYTHGEKLELTAGQCCPRCTHEKKPCQFRGQSVQHRTEWNTPACQTCRCLDGQVVCANTSCPSIPCKPGEVRHLLPGQCCPKCLPAGRACIHDDGIRRQDGSEWFPLPCTKCVCRNGYSKCMPVDCPSIACPGNSKPFHRDGQCCPACDTNTCQEDGIVHLEGQSWNKNDCITCTCHKGQVVCKSLTCNDSLTCPRGQLLKHRKGQCCPQCVRKRGKCRLVGADVHYHGDMWKAGPCEYCSCQKGLASCHMSQCQLLECKQGQEKKIRPDQCCPQCITPATCKYNGQIFQNGQKWDPDSCSTCECKDSKVRCYRRTCPACHSGTTAVAAVNGHCCGQCTAVQCDDECSLCNPSYPLLCTSCKDRDKLIQDGRCVDMCKEGFFPDFDNTCKRCYKTCRTCYANSDFHCLSCAPNHFMRDGECVGQCGDGYFPWKTFCTRCHSSCSACNGPRDNQCLVCRLQGQVLQSGRCVDSCGKGYYLERSYCRRCPSSCQTCLPDSAECDSCPVGSYLTKGQCLQTCPRGYYNDSEDKCQACYPSCLKCKGPKMTDCTDCIQGKYLDSGKCKGNGHCEDGRYISLDLKCLDCHATCETCHQDVSSEGSLCSQCKDLNQFPLGPRCHDLCPKGSVLSKGGCFVCEDKCQQCDTDGRCIQCFSPFSLSHGHCVMYCGIGKFSSKGVCLDCKNDCLQCDDDSMCTSCKADSMLKNGQCVSNCGNGFIPRWQTRICEENQFPPKLVLLQPITVTQGSMADITEKVLDLSDADTPSDFLSIIIENIPISGQIIQVDTMGNTLLSEGDEFLPKDLIHGRIRYIQPSHSVKFSDAIFLKAFDGQHYSDSVKIPINIQPKDRMELISQKPLVTKAGGEVVLNENIINVKTSSESTDISIICSVLDGPVYGHILNKMSRKEVKKFTLDELKKGSIAYLNHGNESHNMDLARIHLEDGFSDIYLLLTIKILAKTSVLPVIITNTGGHVPPDGILKITKNKLETKIQETMNVQTQDAVYTLSPTKNNPRNGEVLLLLPIPKNGPKEGWQVVEQGMMATRMFRFTQGDINAGRIYYRHTAVDTLDDEISFKVSDTAQPPNVLNDQSFHIQVSTETLPLSNPTIAPEVHLGITVFENQIVPITSRYMAFQDDYTPSTELVYKITRLLSSDEGTVEHIDFPFKPVLQFTQDDINNNRIIYRPPQDEIGKNSMDVSFSFIVTDGKGGGKLTEHQFTIQVVPVNNNPPHFTNPVVNISVIEKSHVQITPAMLDAVDGDTPQESLELMLVTAPKAGMIEKLLNGIRIVLREGDKFSYADFRQGNLKYIHAGSVNPPLDAIIFSLSDGVHQANATINILILKIDKSAPQMLPTASCQLNVTEGATVTITRSEIVFSDSDDKDESISLVLAKETTHGHFIKNGKRIDVGEEFSQEDINQGYIRFVTEKEIGSSPITELVYLNVSDSSGNTLNDQVISVLIQPVDNLAPVVSFGVLPVVEEGGQVAIDPNSLNIMDIDTHISGLTIVVKKKPTFGQIHDKQPVRGSERKRSGVKEFSVSDFLDGNIIYVNTDHKDKEPVADAFLFYITDGTNESPVYRFNISIQLINDEPPSIITEQLFVEEGQAVTLTNASMFVVDFDTIPRDLLFTVDSTSVNGFLLKKEFTMDTLDNAVTLKDKASFSYEDILQELIVYQHDDSETTQDFIKLSLTDGDFSDSKTINIMVGIINDETPRVKVNRGLRIKAGSKTVITSKDLKATDLDSVDENIQYTIMRDPNAGSLQFDNHAVKYILTTKTAARTFQQKDINNGHILYSHSMGEPTGNILFKFKLSDQEGNELIDQDFFITVLEDRLLPVEVSNKEFLVTEGSAIKLTTDYLSFTDYDSEPGSLSYTVLDGPRLGHLELTDQPGVPVVVFTQSDLAANAVLYVHSSQEEHYMDKFIFSVTDGKNEVMSSFYIKIKPVDDAIPSVINKGLRVQEGVRKLITEFNLKALDQDTQEKFITFTVLDPPAHGSLDLSVEDNYKKVSSFTMEDIYENRVSYQHDGSETVSDIFKFVVSDGTNEVFTMQRDEPSGSPISSPQDFEIVVLPMDDGMPVLDVNLGLQFLESKDGQIGNVISSRELMSIDEDTDNEEIIYTVTEPPRFGILESSTNPGSTLLSFSQEDVNKGLVHYILQNKTSLFQDSFVFSVRDSKPNVIPENQFHIMWSEISLADSSFDISETDGVIQVPILRKGNLKQYSIVKCSTVSASAVSENTNGRSELPDFVQMSGQVQFDEWQEEKTCNIFINDDTIFEGEETFLVHISSPSYAVLGELQRSSVIIHDEEDEPVLQFSSEVLQVNETDGIVKAMIKRSGDLTDSVSVICSTHPLTATGSSLKGLESGSDYVSRGDTNEYRVIFPSGVSESSCDIKLVDDSENEPMEQFEARLSQPSLPATMGAVHTLIIVIEGPNDESFIYFSGEEFSFPENSDEIELPVSREGSDLSHVSTVWCATRMSQTPSARPGQDYIPSSTPITFGPGQSIQFCPLTLLDDEFEPRLEGNETFQVFLSSAIGSNLKQPIQATVIIFDDSLDLPRMSFAQDSFSIDETNSTLNISIVRQGDIYLESSVICYTRQKTAEVSLDYKERTFTNESFIVFKPGEKVKPCLVEIIDDASYEMEEIFLLKLGQPKGTKDSGAVIGDLDTMVITITDQDDVPRISFEESAYSINEPSVVDQVSSVVLKVVRMGAINGTAWVRCSTRDGSAVSGVDYNAKSMILHFEPGQRTMDFAIDVLYNSALEWHESFSVQLGPEISTETQFGSLGVATVTILDNEVSGSLVLPAAPVVISLLHYGDIETGTKVNPSPGYPLVCITPCDAQHSAYPSTHKLCTESKINHTTIVYSWEVGMPGTEDGVSSPFVTITDQTMFTFTDKKVLDSIYFRSFFKVRCIAQPVHENGNPGVPVRSLPVTIGHTNPICKAPNIPSNSPYSYQAQSFLARLEYMEPGAEEHPNTLHISVEIPHQDGMLPLISTHPLHNLRLLLSNSVYRQQHICSNIILQDELLPLVGEAFLGNGGEERQTLPLGPGRDFPHQFDASLRSEETLLLYKHLNLKSCKWQFDAWYHMTELVDLCGGHVLSDFQVKDKSLTHLTVRVPLYVSYVFVTAPRGWSSLEHHSDMEFSFYYSTVLWSSGLETEERQGGRLQVVRILIGDDGKLVIEFRTQAKFRGLFVLSHHSLPEVTSLVIAPKSLTISFDLELVWSQATFDGPLQMWRAKSKYNLKDYTGVYKVDLLPCLVSPTQRFVQTDSIPCAAKQPERFEIPISFQQTNRPVPVLYSLNTEFQLGNSLDMFLSSPGLQERRDSEWDFNGAFSKGQRLYGRVLWHPDQDLKDGYRLALDKVFLCTGRNGYVPTFDPAGEVYGEGPQYGCLQPSTRLLYRFLILDGESPEDQDTHFQQIPFNAVLAGQDSQYTAIRDMPGVDGFAMDVDPLYKVDSGHEWYLQVVYTIGISETSKYRQRRSSQIHNKDGNLPLQKPLSLVNTFRNRLYKVREKRETNRSQPHYWDQKYSSISSDTHNGTNMQLVHLVFQTSTSSPSTSMFYLPSFYVPVSIFCLLVVFLFIICIRKRVRHKNKNDEYPPSFINNFLETKNNPRNAARVKKHIETDLKGLGIDKKDKNLYLPVKKYNVKKNDVSDLTKQDKNVCSGTEV